LMPNPKAGTVTTDVEKVIGEVKKGKIEFKMDKQSNIHAMIGKLSFETKALFENGSELIESVERAKPHIVKGVFLKNMSISSTMGPGLRLDTSNWRR
jgi:large subunit ribosomal protein L1